MTNANCNIFQKLWKKIIKGKFIFITRCNGSLQIHYQSCHPRGCRNERLTSQMKMLKRHFSNQCETQ